MGVAKLLMFTLSAASPFLTVSGYMNRVVSDTLISLPFWLWVSFCSLRDSYTSVSSLICSFCCLSMPTSFR